jgi:hypothetical protein
VIDPSAEGLSRLQAAVTAEERHRPKKDRVSGELPFPLEAIGLGADERALAEAYRPGLEDTVRAHDLGRLPRTDPNAN